MIAVWECARQQLSCYDYHGMKESWLIDHKPCARCNATAAVRARRRSPDSEICIVIASCRKCRNDEYLGLTTADAAQIAQTIRYCREQLELAETPTKRYALEYRLKYLEILADRHAGAPIGV